MHDPKPASFGTAETPHRRSEPRRGRHLDGPAIGHRLCHSPQAVTGRGAGSIATVTKSHRDVDGRTYAGLWGRRWWVRGRAGWRWRLRGMAAALSLHIVTGVCDDGRRIAMWSVTTGGATRGDDEEDVRLAGVQTAAQRPSVVEGGQGAAGAGRARPARGRSRQEAAPLFCAGPDVQTVFKTATQWRKQSCTDSSHCVGVAKLKAQRR